MKTEIEKHFFFIQVILDQRCEGFGWDNLTYQIKCKALEFE